MQWNQYRLKTTTQAEDLISYALSEIGIEGVQIEDKVPLSRQDQEQMFIDILPQPQEDDGMAYITFYIDPDRDMPDMADRVLEAVNGLRDFVDVGEASIEVSQTADEDWMNNWKKYWKPFPVEEGIWIRPSWEELPAQAEGSLVVELDPGTSFGTGTHHTTRLCVRQLKKYLKAGDRLLDVGCGSGILFIIAALLGAKTAAADVDIHAVQIARDNALRNHLPSDSYAVFCGDLISDSQFLHQLKPQYCDIVVANILADVIIRLADVFKNVLRPGTVFISSGILDTKEKDVRGALKKAGFTILEASYSGEWVCLTAVSGGDLTE